MKMDQGTFNYASKKGLFVLKQNENSMKIENNENFKYKKWKL